MSQRGKRGIAQCTKTYPATSYTVTFNAIGLADSDTAQRFATWMGVEVRARVSYLKGWKQITTQELDQLWLRAKVDEETSCRAESLSQIVRAKLFMNITANHAKKAFRSRTADLGSCGNGSVQEIGCCRFMQKWVVATETVLVKSCYALLEYEKGLAKKAETPSNDDKSGNPRKANKNRLMQKQEKRRTRPTSVTWWQASSLARRSLAAA
ncbi:hypothetical protein Tco_0378497 [Tanacetum coccineum]